MASKKPLVEYLHVEGDALRPLVGMMLDQADDVGDQLSALRGKDKISDQVTAMQARGVRRTLRAASRYIVEGSQAAIEQGYRDAAMAASELVSAEEATLLSLVLPSSSLSDLAHAEAFRAAGAIETAMARMNSSKIPLSEQVYRTGLIARNQVDKYVDGALLRGLSWGDFAKGARDLINPNTPGGVAYAAKRLARTEINNAFHAATAERYANSGVKGLTVDWNLSESHPTRDLCNEYEDEGPYDPEQIPKKPHPQCLCYITANLPDEDDFINALFGDNPDEQPTEIDTSAFDYDIQNTLRGRTFKSFLDAEGDSDDKWWDDYVDEFENLGAKFGERIKSAIPGGNVEVAAAFGQEADGSFSLIVRFMDSVTGQNLGRANRRIERAFANGNDPFDGLVYSVDHSLFQLEKAAQGRGISTAFLRESENLYRQMGMEQITTHANIDVGGYAWARSGFDWNREHGHWMYKRVWQRFQSRLDADEALIAAGKTPLLSAADRAALHDLSKRSTEAAWKTGKTPTPFELSQLGYNNSDMWLGKEVMLGSDWAGVKVLPKIKAPAPPAGTYSPSFSVADGMKNAENVRKALEKTIYDAKGNYNAAKGWTSESRSAWTSYTEMGHRDMNLLLRDPKAFLAKTANEPWWFEEFDKRVKLLQGIINKTETSQDLVVARGVLVGPGFNPATFKAGDLFTDPAFLSTTTDMEQALGFAAGRGRINDVEGWTFITKVPKGTNAVPGVDYQNEIIFGPGQNQRVLGVDKAKKIIYTEMTS